MTTKPKDVQIDNPTALTCQERSEVLVKHVMHALGHPRDLFQVKVHHLWGNRYRVNVLMGSDFFSAVIAHSYFVVTDDEGAVLRCSPKLA